MFFLSAKSQKISLQDYLNNLKLDHNISFSYSNPLIDGLYMDGYCNEQISACLLRLYSLNIDFQIINEDQIALFPMKTMEIKGFILDSLSKEPLIGAHIYNPTSNQGAVTDENGFFHLTTPRVDSLFKISYIGFQCKSMNVNDATSHILLGPQDLNPVLVVGRNPDYISKYTLHQDEMQLLNAGLFEQLPSLGAEPDVMQYATQTPGVYLGTDGVSGLRVRGGSTDQNLISIDEVPIYYPFHILGYKSIFSSSDISQLNLIEVDSMAINKEDYLPISMFIAKIPA